MRCIVPECGRPIPAARLEVSPRALTCSRACSAIHTRALHAAANRRLRARKRKSRAGASED